MSNEPLWLEFEADGRLQDPTDKSRLAEAIKTSGAKALVVMSHGWKNDREAAERIYEPLWRETSQRLGETADQFLVVRVLWPSVPFRNHVDAPSADAGLSDGGALGVTTPVQTQGRPDPADLALEAALADYKDVTGDEALSGLAEHAGQDLRSAEARQLVEKLVASFGSETNDPELAAESGTLKEAVESGDTPADVLQELIQPPAPATSDQGGALGLGDDVGRMLSGGKAAVARLIGQATYFQIKRRAGVVGKGLGDVLADLDLDIALHLVGHSFGARLVTAAADRLVEKDRDVTSLTLLQGAFSHNALSPSIEGRPGAFRRVAEGRVKTIAITHTHNDTACTGLYATASRISRDIAAGYGHADDRFGSMGANGAQGLAEVTRHTKTPEENAPPQSGVNNYLADEWIVGIPPGNDAHGDVFNPHVGHLLASVLKADQTR